MKIKARLLRWCHLLRHLHRGHRAVTIRDERNPYEFVVAIKCTCGKEWE